MIVWQSVLRLRVTKILAPNSLSNVCPSQTPWLCSIVPNIVLWHYSHLRECHTLCFYVPLEQAGQGNLKQLDVPGYVPYWKPKWQPAVNENPQVKSFKNLRLRCWSEYQWQQPCTWPWLDQSCFIVFLIQQHKTGPIQVIFVSIYIMTNTMQNIIDKFDQLCPLHLFFWWDWWISNESCVAYISNKGGETNCIISVKP